MLLNYLQTGWRSLLRYKTLSFINILGLATGISACLIIFLYVRNELTYDAYNPKAGRIVRVTSAIASPESNLELATSPVPLAGALVRELPEVESSIRIKPASIIVRQGTDVFEAEDFYYTEPGIFKMFAFTFIEGSAASAFAQPHAIALSRKSARHYFGNRPAVGQVLVCNKENYTVSAVFEDRPANSDLTIEALLYEDFSKVVSWTLDDFESYTFALFRQAPDTTRLNKKLAGMSKRYIQPELDKQGASDYHINFHSELLKDVHFSAGKLIDSPKGNRQFNKFFSLLAGFILFIAMLNYINLATARSAERMKEVGVRKVIGAANGQLIRQFLGESSFLVLLAWVMAIGIVELSLPFFNKALTTHLSLSAGPILLLSLVLIPVVTFLAGGYPAFVLSRFIPVKSLKGAVKKSKGVNLRRVLTVMQFVIALAMLAGTAVSYKQMRFMMDRDLGADRSQLIGVAIPTDSVLRKKAPAFVETLRHESSIHGLTVGSGIPAEGVMMSSTTAYNEGRKRQLLCNYFMIDPQFLSLYHIGLKEGRNFSDSLTTDKKEGFIVNEAFAQTMQWKQAIGQTIEGGERKGKVIGVVKNFFFKSLHNVIEPAILIYKPEAPMSVVVKAFPSVMPVLKQDWKRFFPDQPFDSYFADENFNKQYDKDRTSLMLFNAFTILAIIISCLGLYGLVSLVVLQRTKEIGIRKVLGASMSGLMWLLSTEQLRLIVCASLIALPLALLGANRWLTTYAYHITLSVWVITLPVLGLLLLAVFVTGFHIFRAARANPIESLRTE